MLLVAEYVVIVPVDPTYLGPVLVTVTTAPESTAELTNLTFAVVSFTKREPLTKRKRSVYSP